jgi:NAD(P)-dependent dehydrogenase (short-subunit alcohol dehydrogenase family)
MTTPQTILITGSNSGFGRLMSESLARRGHTVFAAMREMSGRNAAAAAELRGFADGEIHPVEIDVTVDASAEAGVAAVLAQTEGRLDVVVNNATVGSLGHEECFTPAQLLAMYDLNVVGVHRVNRAALPAMRARGSGLIVHISSMIGRTVIPAMGTYCSTKFALEALAEAYAYTLAPLGIDSVIVEPGAYPTDFGKKGVWPADPGRAEGYGPLAEMPMQMVQGLAQMFSGPDAPNPQAVADAVVRLVETPFGQRPLRMIVDAHPEGVQAINDVSAQVQAGLLSAFGLGGLVRQPAA